MEIVGFRPGQQQQPIDRCAHAGRRGAARRGGEGRGGGRLGAQLPATARTASAARRRPPRAARSAGGAALSSLRPPPARRAERAPPAGRVKLACAADADHSLLASPLPCRPPSPPSAKAGTARAWPSASASPCAASLRLALAVRAGAAAAAARLPPGRPARCPPAAPPPPARRTPSSRRATSRRYARSRSRSPLSRRRRRPLPELASRPPSQARGASCRASRSCAGRPSLRASCPTAAPCRWRCCGGRRARAGRAGALRRPHPPPPRGRPQPTSPPILFPPLSSTSICSPLIVPTSSV